MTKKRFVQTDYDEIYYITDTETMPKYPEDYTKEEIEEWYVEHSMTGNEVIDTLNNFNDETRELQEANHSLYQDNKRLELENQHIKNTIQTLYENERTELGKSVLKQLMNNLEGYI